MGKLLDFSEDSAIATDVLDLLITEGYTLEQIAAGLALAIRRIAGQFDTDQILDEAVDVLMDSDAYRD